MLINTKQVTFSASHRLHNPNFTDEENLEIFDKCGNPNGHGHNYILQVSVIGQPDENTGYVIDLKKLKRILNEVILNKIDHKNLNIDVEFLKGVIPTMENIAVCIWNELEPHINEGKLYKIKLYETPESFIEYYGEKVEIKRFN